VTRYRAALPDHAGPAANHNSPPADAQAAGLAEVLGPDAERLIDASFYREPASLDHMIAERQPTDLHDLIEARYQLLAAGEMAQAWRLTEIACCLLHARGDFGQEATLISEMLVRLPEHSTARAGWIFELGKIAQVRTDYAVAEGCFKQALDMFTAARDRAGVSRCYYSLGVLAQARGDYAEAELCYRQSTDAASSPAAPAASPAAQPAPATWPQTAGSGAGKRDTVPAAQWRAPGLVGLALGLLALSVTEICTTLTPAGLASPAPPSAAAAGPSAVASQEAGAWVAGQISHSAVVSCDPAMCSELETRGVPAGDLLMLGPGGPQPDGPLSSDVVVATRAVRTEFGGRLADVYAPVVLAAFGSGGARVEIRAVAPGGAAAYRDALAADLAARRQAGAQLLRNPDVTAAAAARGPLSDGSVDSRLLVTLAVLADLRLAHPLRIISFGEPDPGASAGVPLRSAEISGPASQALLAFLRAQQAPYRAAVIRAIRLDDGQAAVRIGFASPSPLGLLAIASPTAQAAPPA
jgi:hypothetical protein